MHNKGTCSVSDLMASLYNNAHLLKTIIIWVHKVSFLFIVFGAAAKFGTNKKYYIVVGLDQELWNVYDIFKLCLRQSESTFISIG